jgi:hypothetical protein
VFRTLLFKFFNRIDTWNLLEAQFGELRWNTFDLGQYDRILSTALSQGIRLYSAAYVMPCPPFGADRKHTNHLLLLKSLMESSFPQRIVATSSLRELYELLLTVPSLGPFLAFQYAIDINYSNVTNFDEMEFVIAGPGARDGLYKCFGHASVGIESNLIRWVADTQDEHFDRLRLNFDGLNGRKLQLIDCQNLFCEVDKYARVAHPDIAGRSGRTRIKQHYDIAHARSLPSPWFPPKWGINPPRKIGSQSVFGQSGGTRERR